MTSAIEDLRRSVAGCRTCDDMDHVHILGPANGPAGARVMFIGEAPGRLGAARTGAPFTADQAGRRFQRLLTVAGLHRGEVFITNALLCNPLRNGKNRPPRRREVAACAPWLRAQIDAVSPGLVVTLGRAALEAARLIEPHTLEMAADCGRPQPWYGRTLVALYHPSPRTVAHRPFEMQAADFRQLGEMLSRSA